MVVKTKAKPNIQFRKASCCYECRGYGTRWCFLHPVSDWYIGTSSEKTLGYKEALEAIASYGVKPVR